MLNLMNKKYNQYFLFAGLCALISLLPVLNYSLAVPGEMVLTLTAWFLSNSVIVLALFLYSRFDRTVTTRA